MIRFNNDYNEGAHENIIKKMTTINLSQICGYGEDEYCREAADIIKNLCKKTNADVHFLVGGTQTNLTVIASALKPYQCAVSASTGHINVHETGAIEATGHKVFSIETDDGKLKAEMIKSAYETHWNDESHEHIAQPKLVYISNPTEIGTIYSKKELEDIYKTCRECNLYLYIDGARLAYGLGSEKNDLDFETIASNCDIFYIGGTKCGALFGEAVVILNDSLKEDFRYMIKQRGGMLAKGWLLGLQFTELLKDGLYIELAKNADRLAAKIKEAVIKEGYPLYSESYTNQQFIIFPDELIEELNKKYALSYQQKYDDTHSVIRICTDWATKEENVDSLIKDIKK
ncbi:MAG: low specificity L-threonine aldolase [Candidatus Metalachnospira sp.]|nr:low specificity L-threonine aldolase [Candidatus Metalachnospira sp.]